jgi:hypothetical protein
MFNYSVGYLVLDLELEAAAFLLQFHFLDLISHQGWPSLLNLGAAAQRIYQQHQEAVRTIPPQAEREDLPVEAWRADGSM